jgi:hypothetical protein
LRPSSPSLQVCKGEALLGEEEFMLRPTSSETMRRVMRIVYIFQPNGNANVIKIT